MTSARQILSETVDVPGYGEDLDPARLPPYTEDLGGGNTHQVDMNGIEYWTLNGKLHRDGDLPALIYPDGTQEWHRNGRLHRGGDKPAVIRADTTRIWCWDGLRHRGGDKPAYIRPGGEQTWYRHGKIHRDGDTPAIVYPSGSLYWYRNGKQHRYGDKPAVVAADGREEYWRNGERIDPPERASVKEGVSIPGYGEAVDPARLPPYAEDLGNGVTHRVSAYGTERWYKDGKLHRNGDLPAIVYPSGTQVWYQHDKLHRDGDKPAVVYPDGTEEYWVDGKQVPKP